MKSKKLGSFLIAGVCVLLFLPGCVSSKKYKASQAALQQVRNDSARLAQQVETLNGNIHTMEQKTATLQQTLDQTSANYAAAQKSLSYYQTYFEKQQTALTQLHQELKDTLSRVGIADEDLQQKSGSVYVTLDENNLFKRNSTAVTMKGKQVITNLATVLKSHPDMVVSVENNFAWSGNPSAGPNNMNDNMASSSGEERKEHPKYHKKVMKTSVPSSGDKGNAKKTTVTGSTSATASASTSTTSGNTTVKTHKRVHRNYSTEGGDMTYSNGVSSTYSRTHKKEMAAYMLRTGRVHTVAKGLLQNGVPQVNLVLRNQPAMSTENSKNGIQVVITPAMKEFTPPEKPSAVGKANEPNN